MRVWLILQVLVGIIVCNIYGVANAFAQEGLNVRGGDHGGYSRLVFDWDNVPAYYVANSSGNVIITFEKVGGATVTQIPENLRNIHDVKKTSAEKDNLALSMTIPKDSRIRDFVVGGKIILDVYDGTSSLQKASDAKPVEKEVVLKAKEVLPDDVKKENSAKESQDFSLKKAEKAVAVPTAFVDVTPISTPKIQPHEISLTTVTSVGLAVYQRHGNLWIITDAPDVETQPKFEGPEVQKFSALEKTKLTNGMMYRLELPDGVVAHAQGGGLTWKIILDQSPASKNPPKIVLPKKVTLGGHEKLNWSIEKLNKTIHFTDPFSGDDVTAITSNSAAQTSGHSLNFVDFQTLDNIVGFSFASKREGVVSNAASDGVIIDRNEGLVLANGEKVKTELIRKELSSEKMSKDSDSPELSTHEMEHKDVSHDDTLESQSLTLTEEPPAVASADHESEVEDVKKELGHEPAIKIDTAEILKASKEKPTGNNIYNFPRWEMGGIKSLGSSMHALMAEVAAKPVNDRTEDVITMAKLLLANNRAPEALGMLRIAVQQVPELEKSPEFESLHAAALALAGKFDEAIVELSQPELKDYDDIKIWKAYTLAGLEDWKQAGTVAPSDTKFLTTYPAEIRYPLAFKFAEIALRNAKAKDANDILDDLKPDLSMMSLANQSSWKYLVGETQRQNNNLDKAQEYWRPLVEHGKDDLYRAKAGLSLTKLEIDNKTLKPNEAISRLEGLRYAWRGDELETLINYRLGKLYVDNKDYLKGLTVLRNAMTLTPELEIHNDVKQLMENTFRDVFVNNQLSTMPPIDAISFYEEFKDLTPVGTEGNEYVEKLAERLVDADLLGRASALLEFQVNNKLQGDKKAEVAIRLAAIRLLDGNPDGALRSLEIAQDTLDKISGKKPSTPLKEIEKNPENISAQAGDEATPVAADVNAATKEKFDPEKQRQIYLLKARALSMKNKPDDALKILETMRVDSDVNKLRTDIAWTAGKWEDAAAALNDLIVSEDVPSKGKVTDYQRDIILNRAIALNLSSNRVELANFRDRYLVQMKDTTKSDMFDVVTRSRSSDVVGSREAIGKMMSEIDLFKGFLDSYSKSNKPIMKKEDVAAKEQDKPVVQEKPATTPDEKSIKETSKKHQRNN